MAETDNQFTRRLCFGIYATHKAFNRFYQAILSESGLTYPKLVILSALKDAGPLSVSDLSIRAGVEPNTLSPLLKKMAAFGTITRDRDKDDDRRVVIGLTDRGRALVARADAVVLEGFAELGLDHEKMIDTVRFLETVRARLEDADPPKLRASDLIE